MSGVTIPPIPFLKEWEKVKRILKIDNGIWNYSDVISQFRNLQNNINGVSKRITDVKKEFDNKIGDLDSRISTNENNIQDLGTGLNDVNKRIDSINSKVQNAISTANKSLSYSQKNIKDIKCLNELTKGIDNAIKPITDNKDYLKTIYRGIKKSSNNKITVSDVNLTYYLKKLDRKFKYLNPSEIKKMFNISNYVNKFSTKNINMDNIRKYLNNDNLVKFTNINIGNNLEPRSVWIRNYSITSRLRMGIGKSNYSKTSMVKVEIKDGTWSKSFEINTDYPYPYLMEKVYEAIDNRIDAIMSYGDDWWEKNFLYYYARQLFIISGVTMCYFNILNNILRGKYVTIDGVPTYVCSKSKKTPDGIEASVMVYVTNARFFNIEQGVNDMIKATQDSIYSSIISKYNNYTIDKVLRPLTGNTDKIRDYINRMINDVNDYNNTLVVKSNNVIPDNITLDDVMKVDLISDVKDVANVNATQLSKLISDLYNRIESMEKEIKKLKECGKND